MSDLLYLRLKGAREKLCAAQVLVDDQRQTDALGEAIDRIDRVGVFLPQWSNFDEPTVDLVSVPPAPLLTRPIEKNAIQVVAEALHPACIASADSGDPIRRESTCEGCTWAATTAIAAMLAWNDEGVSNESTEGA